MITLIGLSDPDFTIKGDMFNEVPAMVNTKLNSLIDDENSYTILLSHRPELFETYVCCGVDLVLCGHAHGGQFRLPLLGGLLPPIKGCFLNMIPVFIQTERQIWLLAAALEIVLFHSDLIIVQRLY